MREVEYSYVLAETALFDDGSLLVTDKTMPTIHYREKLKLKLNVFDVALTGTHTDLTADVYSLSIDNDWRHVFDATFTADTSGTVTEINLSGIESTMVQYIPASGFVYLENSAGEYESVTYTARKFTSNVLKLTVAVTLTHVYELGDIIKIKESLIVKENMGAFITTNVATGQIEVVIDANTQQFNLCTKNTSGISNPLCEIQCRLIDGTILYAIVFRINCLNLLDDDGEVPPGPVSEYYDKDEIDALLGSSGIEQRTSDYTEEVGNVGKFWMRTDAIEPTVYGIIEYVDGGVITYSKESFNVGGQTVAQHEAAYIHTDIALNTSARHTHTNKTTLDEIPAVGTEGQVLTVTSTGLNWEDVFEPWITTPPTTPTSAGIKGQRVLSGNYLYECVDTNKWVRTAVETAWS